MEHRWNEWMKRFNNEIYMRCVQSRVVYLGIPASKDMLHINAIKILPFHCLPCFTHTVYFLMNPVNNTVLHLEI